MKGHQTTCNTSSAPVNGDVIPRWTVVSLPLTYVFFSHISLPPSLSLLFQPLVANNSTCSDQCDSSYRCWGPNDTQCVSCVNFDFNGRCVASCDFESLGVYVSLL